MKIAPAVEQYVSSIIQTCAAPSSGIVSAVLFGSASTGAYSPSVSDVDLLIVLLDGATMEDKEQVRDTISQLEEQSGLGKHTSGQQGALDALADRITNNVRSFFVCTRSDLLSGEPARILDITALQAVFVDRVAIPSILASGITIWGEDLLPHVRLPLIRRVDVAKAFFSLFNQALIPVVAYPFLSDPTRYAMDTLKRSLHNCFFVYHTHSAHLADEVVFFEQRVGTTARSTLAELMTLRATYHPSFAFTLRCLPTLVQLHWITAWTNSFPQKARLG